MYNLLGEYDCKLDAKGRFLVPSGLRKQLPEDEQIDFVINRGLEECLVLYPRKVWDKEMERLAALNPFDKKAQAFKRLFRNGATPVELDGNGRALISKGLMERAGLTKEIKLISDIDRVEIWDKSKYEAWLNDPSNSLADLADEVMVDK